MLVMVTPPPQECCDGDFPQQEYEQQAYIQWLETLRQCTGPEGAVLRHQQTGEPQGSDTGH